MSDDKERESDAQSQTLESAMDPARQNSELEALRQELAAKELESKQNYDRFLRQVAELENLKRRNAREREDLSRFANETLIKDLLPIVDNLERAIEHAGGGGNGKSIVEGVEMVLKGLLDVLAKHGVEQISAIGQPFDPTKHEAIAHVDSEMHEANAVVDELHKGYLLHERLLRPALVSVAKGSTSREKKNDHGEVEKEPTDD